MSYKSMIFLIAVTLFIISGCSKSTIVEPTTSSKGTGQMLMKVDRSSIPSGVATITAVLSRTGFDTLTSSFSVGNDTAAQIAFQSVTVGTWNVKIDAKSVHNIVMYSGTATVEVTAGNTTQLSVTLNPVATTGGIQISIVWGTAIQASWADYPANPIIKKTNNTYESGGVIQPCVVYENGTYKMWFSSITSNAACVINYATSPDGINWTRNATPVITPGQGTTWDAASTIAGPVIKVDNTYRMYYTGFSNRYNNWNIGLATSPDGITWTKSMQPVLLGTSGDEYQIGATDVLKFNNKYYLYYGIINVQTYKIFVAVSDDGLSWTRYSGNPVLTGTQSWESTGVAYGTVAQDGNILRMAFQNGAMSGFGFATSTDGLHWTQDSGNPFFSNSQTANNWTSQINYPLLRNFNNEWRIYYCGNFNLNNPETGIGLIRKY